ncbi:equilibrative nucleoside transporter 1-like isoform X1 [Amphibalanus amphitrite]|uniref:equilibrative nucleoside transporter 1-like isoform X1 n=1 Tax=Amphibalanus amphitrite TaxID=1232801 RepID=UPI001C916FC5|nr:equilibrative nucleoside transporter 1-like isoform X1 [Amphibalanus amphitrite]
MVRQRRLAGAVMPDIVPSVVPAVLPAVPPAVPPAVLSAVPPADGWDDSDDSEEYDGDSGAGAEGDEGTADDEALLGSVACGHPVRHPNRSTVIYCIFYLLGMGTLLPWNFFITADSYWNYKFRNVTSDSTDDTEPTELQYNFFGYLSVASMVPNTIFLTLNAVLGHNIKQQVKLVSSLMLVIVFFIITTVLVPIDSDDWQNTFFAVTMVMVVILNMGAAVFQGGLFGLAAQFPARYLSAVISGQALGAVFACVARIVSIAVSSGQDPDSAAVNSALVYFILADVTLVVSIACYVWMSRMSFYEYYTRASRLTSATDDESVARADSERSNDISVWRIFLKIKWYALSVCLVFVVTLALFPAVTAKIIPKRQEDGDPNTWTRDYFVPVCCFLLFNGCDYIGRILGGFTVWPKMNHWYLVLGFTLLRFAFFPLFMFCNNGQKNLSIVFEEDAYYIVFMVVFGLSNGYLSTLCMIYGPSLVEPEEQNTASSMMAAFLGLGLCLGALLSNLSISLL